MRNTFIIDNTPLNCVIFYNNRIESSTQNDSQSFTHYFQLDSTEYKNLLTTGSYGWKQLSVNDSTYLSAIANIVTKKNGNNPHSAPLPYDSGAEYLSYFKKLFKYACENKEFDMRCYPNQTIDSLVSMLSNSGFTLSSTLIVDKTMSFCDYYQSDNGELTEFKYKDVVQNENEYNFKSNQIWKDLLNIQSLNNIGFKEQIINVKKIDISFYVYTNSIDYVNYIKNIILPYLTQLIPSTTIVEVNYKIRRD